MAQNGIWVGVGGSGWRREADNNKYWMFASLYSLPFSGSFIFYHLPRDLTHPSFYDVITCTLKSEVLSKEGSQFLSHS